MTRSGTMPLRQGAEESAGIRRTPNASRGSTAVRGSPAQMRASPLSFPIVFRLAKVQAMKRSLALVLMCVFTAVSAALAQGPDDQYVRIYNLIQEGDTFNGSGQKNQAMAKYLE